MKSDPSFLSLTPLISDQVHRQMGSGVGVYIVIPLFTDIRPTHKFEFFKLTPGNAYETSPEGDINSQDTNSGHMKTEGYRIGLFGPYTLVSNPGS
ncbi:putative ASD-1 rhamnogalacturonase B, related protein [Rhizoctonia solani 123E]|uniref:Putative ASD-1 rhamnogalacturonase B, related protein n=1 Tax=Rhizoctonia solani 123E TaxID=1423351 RepID=A0A074RNE8_9AGAM|nr:putative ASD-1 rhamnogalacturonase B, related protein [Rhizoctonia solani 123E]